MSETPIPDSPLSGEPNPPVIADLEREVERLRLQLAKVTAEAESYRRAAYALLNQQVPYVPPTEEELQDLLHGPRGLSLRELIAELQRESEG